LKSIIIKILTLIYDYIQDAEIKAETN